MLATEYLETITLEKRDVTLMYKVSKGRSLRLSIDLLGNVKVHYPKNMPKGDIKDFLIRKSKWIISKLDFVSNLDTRLLSSRRTRQASFKKKRLEAQDFFIKKVEYWNKYYNFEYKNVRISNYKGKWGSCSRTGILSFNYNLIYLEKELIDYVVIHEICHIKEFNHKKEFWKLVFAACPNYLELRNKLKKVVI